jgi:hypothetical protein
VHRAQHRPSGEPPLKTRATGKGDFHQRVAGQGKVQTFASRDVVLAFARDTAGKVETMTLFQPGMEVQMKRVK